MDGQKHHNKLGLLIIAATVFGTLLYAARELSKPINWSGTLTSDTPKVMTPRVLN